MPSFTFNPTRFDPYKNFKFRLKCDGRYVARLTRCSQLRRTTEVVTHQDGGSPSTTRKSSGRTSFDVYRPIQYVEGRRFQCGDWYLNKPIRT